jgi:cytochrome c
MKMKRTGLSLIAAFVTFSVMSGSALAADGDAAAGEELAMKKCTMCHTFGDKFKRGAKIGPSLEGGVAGKAAGKVEGYKYSSAMGKASEDGLAWTDENLDQFLASPKAFIKGTKMMSFPGFKDEADRANVIAFLKTL